MPAKRVIVHTTCEHCGKPIPLAGLSTSVECPACHQPNKLDLADWRWVFGDGEPTVLEGQRVLGETRWSDLHCPACGEALPGSDISKALSAGRSTLDCRCGNSVPLRALPERPGSWQGKLFAAAVGEGAAGAPELPTLQCPGCGAPIPIDGTTREARCRYCSATTPVPEELAHRVDAARIHSFYIWMPPETAEAVARTVRRWMWAVYVGLFTLGVGLLALMSWADKAIHRAHHAPGVGDSCNDVLWVCSPDGKSELHCDHSHYQVAARCLGKKGCTEDAHTVHCDHGQARVGDACYGHSYACSPDGHAELHCEDSRFVVMSACKGPRGCRNIKGNIHCDEDLGVVGDPCDGKGYACSTSKRAELHCDGTQYSVASTCRGAQGCQVTGTKVQCDSWKAKKNDPCIRKNGWACSADKKALLSCDSNHFSVLSRCRGPNGCQVTKNDAGVDNGTNCDNRVAFVGDYCQKNNIACAPDRKTLLECREGRYTTARHCPHGCVMHGYHFNCR